MPLKQLNFLVFMLFPVTLFAHSGGLDSYGCHNETATGTYHCHQGDYAGLSFNSKDEALAYFASQDENDRPSVVIEGGDRVVPDTDGLPGEIVEVEVSFPNVENIFYVGILDVEFPDGQTQGSAVLVLPF